MPTISLSKGQQFVCELGETLLEAAARAGMALPYNCRNGRCSTCKCRVTDGASVAHVEESGLTERDKADGWILGCVRSAVTDMQIEAEDLGALGLAAPRTIPCRVQALAQLAPDVLKVVLRLPPTAGFAFRPGQYIDMIGQDGVRRSYSLASAGAKLLELHIRRVPGGRMSEYWFGNAKVNDLLRLHGPLGTFVLRDVEGLDLVFLATGTGIAPVKAMLESLADAPAQPRSVTVYWGGRTPADLYCDLPGTAHRFVPVLSRAGAEWTGTRGHVQEAYLAAQPDLSRAAVYACGSDAMIGSARIALAGAGLPPERFRSDAFVCSAI